MYHLSGQRHGEIGRLRPYTASREKTTELPSVPYLQLEIFLKKVLVAGPEFDLRRRRIFLSGATVLF